LYASAERRLHVLHPFPDQTCLIGRMNTGEFGAAAARVFAALKM
jgi:hypothetical protein